MSEPRVEIEEVEEIDNECGSHFARGQTRNQKSSERKELGPSGCYNRDIQGDLRMKIRQLGRFLPLLLLLTGMAFAQNTVNPSTCLLLTNCNVTDSARNFVHLASSSVTVTSAQSVTVACSAQVPYQGPDASAADTNGILLRQSWQCSDGSVFSIVLKGYQYYQPSSGGRAGGGSGYRYQITSGADSK